VRSTAEQPTKRPGDAPANGPRNNTIYDVAPNKSGGTRKYPQRRRSLRERRHEHVTKSLVAFPRKNPWSLESSADVCFPSSKSRIESATK